MELPGSMRASLFKFVVCNSHLIEKDHVKFRFGLVFMCTLAGVIE